MRHLHACTLPKRATRYIQSASQPVVHKKLWKYPTNSMSSTEAIVYTVQLKSSYILLYHAKIAIAILNSSAQHYRKRYHLSIAIFKMSLTLRVDINSSTILRANGILSLDKAQPRDCHNGPHSEN